MTEPNNAVLAEQIRQLRMDFNEYRVDTRKEIRELENEVELNRRSTNELNISITYVKDTVKEMKELLNSMAESQNKQTSKNTLLVSILQVAGGIVIAVIGYWAKGQI